MKYRFCTILLFISLTISAAVITQEQAMAIAREFASENGLSMRESPRRVVSQGQQHTASATIYVFNYTDGWVIVSGDDRTRASVLGYSYTGTFDYDSISPALQWWLSEYEQQIISLPVTDESAYMDSQDMSTYALREVAPLVSAAWQQKSPYNDQCPTIGSSRCLAGCVAIAWGQICHYHKWPEMAQGDYEYIWKNNDSIVRSGTINSTYDWGNIRANYILNPTTAQKAEVAKLISDIGNAVHMNYGVNSSGANPDFATGAMAKMFSYDQSMVVRRRKFYDDVAWDSILRAELDSSRVVLYSGWKSTADGGGGHSFVCDGYNNTGMFHFNYGWGGSSNGYFVSSAVKDNYNTSQQITTGIRPDSGSEFPGVDATYIEDFNAKVTTSTILWYTTTTLSFAYESAPRFSLHSPTKVYATVCLEDTLTKERTFLSAKSMTGTGSGDWGWTSAGSWSTTSFPADGDYVAYPVWQVEGETTWHRMRFKKGLQTNVLLQIENKKPAVAGTLPESYFDYQTRVDDSDPELETTLNENVQVSSVKKIIEDGHLVIVRDGKRYSVGAARL